jgi:pimeloyl-ACP methyl ester carboxylesterase
LEALNHYVEGSQNEQRLLLLNPFFSGMQAWKAVLPYFTSKYEAVLVDYPGFGEVRAAPIESIEELSRRIAEVVEALPEKPLHVVGFSFGSWVAQQIAAAQPSALRSLTLIGTSDRIYQHGIHIVTEWLKILDVLGMEAVVAQLGLWSFSTQTFEQNPTFLSKYVRGTMAACADPEVLRNHLEACLHYRQGAALERIKVPTLILRGDLDFLYPRFCSVLLNEAIAGSRMQEIPEAAHAVLWEKTAAVIGSINSFLEQHSNENP